MFIYCVPVFMPFITVQSHPLSVLSYCIHQIVPTPKSVGECTPDDATFFIQSVCCIFNISYCNSQEYPLQGAVKVIMHFLEVTLPTYLLIFSCQYAHYTTLYRNLGIKAKTSPKYDTPISILSSQVFKFILINNCKDNVYRQLNFRSKYFVFLFIVHHNTHMYCLLIWQKERKVTCQVFVI